jgi:3-hydroxyisobutyrate dehydrogenase-like beta-hydroxyacid dehydrogenase
MKQKITFIGLGKMGSAIAEKLIQAGFPLTVYNRTIEKTESLAKIGANVATQLESAVAEADIIFTSLIDDKALISVTKIMLPHLKQGAIHVGTSTVLPSTIAQLSKEHKEQNCFYIAAPVLGIPNAVKSGSASVFCSGDQKSIDTITPLLNSYAISVKNLGEQITDANVLKICMNYSILTAIELISELYAFAEKSGLDTKIVQESLHTVYAHPAAKLYIDKIHNREFDSVNFEMTGGNKDINLFQQAFCEVNVVPDIANIIRGKFTQALATGMAKMDWSAISEIVRDRSGLK